MSDNTRIRPFDYFSDIPSLSNFKMTDESRKLAEDNYKLFLFMVNKYKKRYPMIAESNFDEHIDLFYLAYCKQCHAYVTKHESKHKLSTYIDKCFKSICDNALRHYNTSYMHNWRDNGEVRLDKMMDTEATIGDLVADNRVNIATQYETADLLKRVLAYIDEQIEVSQRVLHFTCNGWLVLKEAFTNDFASTAELLEHLKYKGLAESDTTEEHVRKVLSYYRRKLKGMVENGEI